MLIIEVAYTEIIRYMIYYVILPYQDLTRAVEETNTHVTQLEKLESHHRSDNAVGLFIIMFAYYMYMYVYLISIMYILYTKPSVTCNTITCFDID